jgi:hypothetical protein
MFFFGLENGNLSTWIVGIQADGFSIGGDRRLVIDQSRRDAVGLSRPQIRIERRRITRPAQLDLRRDVAEQSNLKRARDRIRNLGLQRSHVAQVAVIGLLPEVKSRDPIDELRADANRVCGLRSPGVRPRSTAVRGLLLFHCVATRPWLTASMLGMPGNRNRGVDYASGRLGWAAASAEAI